MTFDDDVRDALHGQADAAGEPRGQWSDVVARLGIRRRRQRAWLASASGVVLIAVVAGVLVLRDDPGSTPTVTAGSTTAAPTSTTSGPQSVVGFPAEITAVRSDGHLVRIDSGSGQEIEELGFEGSPSDRDPESGRSFIRSAAWGDDGFVYYTTCCEPAAGSVYRVPVSGGEPELVTDGSAVAPGPDGTLAVVDSQLGVKLLRDQHEAPAIIPLSDGVEGPVDAAWDATGQRLVVLLDHGPLGQRVVVVQARGEATPTEPITPLPGHSWSQPRFGPGGRIYVIDSVAGEPSVVRALDPDGTDAGIIELGAGATALGINNSTAWLVVGLDGGGLAIIDSSGQTVGTVPTSQTYVSIDW